MTPTAILAHQIELAYRLFPLLAIGSLAVSIFFASTVRAAAGGAAAAWFAGAVAVIALRGHFYRQFMAARADPALVPRWHLQMLIEAAASGLLWCAAAMFYFLADDGVVRLIVIVVTTGALAVGAVGYAGIPWASVAYLMPGLTSFGMFIFGDEDWDRASLGIVAILLLAALGEVSLRLGRGISEWCVDRLCDRNSQRGLDEDLSERFEGRRPEMPEAEDLGDAAIGVTAFMAVKECYRQLVEAMQLAHVGHWEWDYATRQARFSREALRIFGKPEDWNPAPDEIASLLAGSDGKNILEQGLAYSAEHLAEFSIDHRIGDGDEARELHTRVRVETEGNGIVRRLIAATQEVTELRGYQQQLHALAFFDPLTGLPNRALFKDRIRQTISDAAWHKDSLGLMLLDLDRFKAINDTLGHSAGDNLLREAAIRLTACVRPYDTVARLDGDEFGVLLPEIRDSADLGNIARKIVAAFAEPFRLEDKELFITCSVGIADYPGDSGDATQLLRCADAAMYHAKSRGRNNFQFYSAELTARTAERLSLDAQLRQAEKNGELELYYQPQIDLASGRLIGAEALLRWNHPVRGLVMPDKFIGIAEDTGLIVSIGEWVLRAACCTARRWNESRTDGIVKVAVNLSPRQFRTDDLVGTIRRALEDSGCRPEWLECEITESLLLGDSENIRALLYAISELGITISIDDFGTGYSSLSYLNRYPVSAIKIDRSFVCDIMIDLDLAELVKAIISMARTLHLQLVAEGVETVEQEAFLSVHGCHIGQGWLYGKAMPETQFEALLMSERPPQIELFPAKRAFGEIYPKGIAV